MQQMANRPIVLHDKIAAICSAAFTCPFFTESGAATFPQLMALALWYGVISYLQNEEEAAVYEKCADQLHDLVYKEKEERFHSWWVTYYCIVGTKFPNVAVRHIPQLLSEAIDHKKFDLTSVLWVTLNESFVCSSSQSF